MGPNKLVQEDRMVQIYPYWSNMVQNQPKKCPNGTGITRSPGLVFFKKINHATSAKLYWSYDPHRSRDSMSPVCGIFLLLQLNTEDCLSQCSAAVQCCGGLGSVLVSKNWTNGQEYNRTKPENGRKLKSVVKLDPELPDNLGQF